MMLKVLGSSSKGNCYILENESEALILEAGIKFQDVKKALNWNIAKVKGCLVTHRHGDHSKYIKDLAGCFYTLALQDVFEFRGVTGNKLVPITPGSRYKCGNFKIIPFEVHHDVPCVGYLIDHPDMGTLMFLTDSYECDYRFADLQHILIECNYSDKYLVEAINEGRTFARQRDRLLKSHLSLPGCLEFLNTSDLSKVKEIVLIHLSSENSNADEFVKAVEDDARKPTYVAYPGAEIDITRIYG